MSSSLNNNLTIQGSTPPSHQVEFANSRQGSSASINTNRAPQQRQSHETGPTSSRRGRSGRSYKGRNNRGADNTTRAQNPNQTDDGGSTQSTIQAVDQAESSIGHKSTGRVIGYKSSGSRGGGKYRQRQQTNQLLSGMENMSGIDIDLAESIAPTSTSAVPTNNDAKKTRHTSNQRKVNLTHLLNYNFERHPRRRYKSQSSSQGDSHYGHYHRGGPYRDANTVHKFSKQQFLQANCQFVALDGHDYTIHKVDPDWPVDWDCIEEVRFKQCASTETTCPVCLEPPVAAKITRCGHIYCWTCMLHYLSLSDENCRQCPICFEPVYRSDLRSVVSHSFANHSPGEEISMRLMIRKKGCVEVEPYKVDSPHEDPPPPGIHADMQPYTSKANLVIVSPSTVTTNIAQRERNELLFKLNTDRDEPEVCFVEQALSALDRRIEKLNQISIDKSRTRDPVSVTSVQTPDEFSKSYLFYQCSDGQHIYLNPFSTKILCHEYSNLENCPHEIKAKILQMDWVSMSEAWRKRFRYLGHLPLTCEFRLIEIDFEKLDLVSARTFKSFEGEIRKRQQERERRAREERKREKIIQVEQNRRIYGIQPSLKINLDSPDQFPSVCDERYLGLTQPRVQSRTDDDLSSDIDGEETVEQSDPNRPQVRSTPDEFAGEQTTSQVNTNDCDSAVAGITLSFKQIQLQEEAKIAENSTKNKKVQVTNNSWASKGQSSSAPGQSSSFAQLLVDAKVSSKEWTKNLSSRAELPSIPANSNAGPSQWPARTTTTAGTSGMSTGSNEDEEELRAPLCEFTISDFIDLNVKSGRKKGKASKSTASTGIKKS